MLPRFRNFSSIRNLRPVRPVGTIDSAIRHEEQLFLKKVKESQVLHKKACQTIPNGVGSSWANSRPTPVWIKRGQGGYVWDVDGNRYVDFHGGYGATLVGHAHPKMIASLSKCIASGTHFAQPVLPMLDVAQALAERFTLPKWRFCNSGTEATMTAVHLMRAATKRDLIIKVEGGYNGHHDALNVSIFRSAHQLGPEDNPSRTPGAGVTQASADHVRIVPFNNLTAVETILDAHKGQIAGMILEPMMMNAGIIPPQPGYLAGLKQLLNKHQAFLAFDEVKTGLVVHRGGATKLYGVTPDIVCLAKALGGGIACGAVGGTEEIMGLIENGTFNQVGTFNGNPLTMQASKTTLTEILTPEAYARANVLGKYILRNALDTMKSFGQSAYGTQAGFKVSVVLGQTEPIDNYRQFLKLNTASCHLHFLKQFNGGVILPPWGKSETLTLSVAHTFRHADLYLENIYKFMSTWSRLKTRQSNHGREGSFDIEG
jgi:glutamate-1-semialdehyde 2,1-aminomutase